jgi:hypothetical protein
MSLRELRRQASDVLVRVEEAGEQAHPRTGAGAGAGWATAQGPGSSRSSMDTLTATISMQ